MQAFEETIIKLAHIYTKQPFLLIDKLEEISPADEKGPFFLKAGLVLSRSSYLLAMAAWNHALGFFIKDRNAVGMSSCYTNIGIAYHCLGDFNSAIKFHKEALKIDEIVGDIVGQGKCHLNLGNIYFCIGDIGNALSSYEKSLKIATVAKDRALKSLCWHNKGNAYKYLGDINQALKFYKKSLAIDEKDNDLTGQLKNHIGIGNVYYNTGLFSLAKRYFEQSLQVSKQLGEKQSKSIAYGNLGNVYCALNELEHSIRCEKKSLRIDRQLGNLLEQSKGYLNLGVTFSKINNHRLAVLYNNKSLKLAQKIHAIDCERVAAYNLAMLHASNNPRLSYKFCKQSIDLSKNFLGTLVNDAEKINYYAKLSEAYQLMVPLCVRLRKKIEAYNYVEESKSRAFLDLISTSAIIPTMKITNELRTLLHEETITISKLKQQQLQSFDDDTKTKFERINELQNYLKLTYQKIGRLDPAYADARSVQPATFHETQKIINEQNEKITVVEYFLTDNDIFIFLVSTKKELNVLKIPIQIKKLNYFLEKYKQMIKNSSAGFPEEEPIWLALSGSLTEPLSNYLRKGDLIYFVPYGILHYLPLHALLINNEPLILNHAIAYLPSASLLKLCLSNGSGKLENCKSFGIKFEDEAEQIAAIFNGELFKGVTKKVLINNMNSDILHFSCHGIYNIPNPLLSGLKLADGLLTAKEIFSLKLKTELVTLSACQTGLNVTSRGDELIGLTRALLYSGAPSVVVSLWSVNSSSTQELMINFYNNLKAGMSKANALSEAQKKLKEHWKHPYYWAPFILVGNYKISERNRN